MDRSYQILAPEPSSEHDLTRREFIETAAAVSSVAAGATTVEAATGEQAGLVPCDLTINGSNHHAVLDTRVTLLDFLREHLQLTGTKKGCDHGQCGACTVIANGKRILSCLSLAIAHDGEHITTIEGLAKNDGLHPMQHAFLEHDGFQCGFCTSGQICSAVAMLAEVREGAASAVTRDLKNLNPVELTDAEIRERMAGNICRCGAYPNIVDAVKAVAMEAKDEAL
jgi:xanthine dehydrogenase YagT iron-sulfur-binding subunit